MHTRRLSLFLFVMTLPLQVAATPRPRAAVPAGPPPVALQVAPVPDSWRWRWTLQNTSSEPVEVVADRRLVSFEIAPVVSPGPRRRRRAPRAPRCVHGSRPASNEAVARVRLLPGQRYSELLDVRDTCNLSVPAALVAGATITARYGFAPARRVPRSRSLLVDEHPDVVGELTATFAAGATPVAGPPAARDDTSLRVIAHAAQAATGEGLRMSVTLDNPSNQPVRTMWQTGLFSFQIEGPDGRATRCNALSRRPDPLRDLFVRLGAHGRRAVVLLPASYCPLGAFDAQGLYAVRAIYQSDESGQSFGFIRSFTGQAESPAVTVRVARGVGPLTPWGPEGPTN